MLLFRPVFDGNVTLSQIRHNLGYRFSLSSVVPLDITMAGYRGRTSIDKQLLKNVIRHTESMNKVHEESEMWRQYKEMETRRKDTSPYRSGQMRSDRRADTKVKTSGGVSPGGSYWTKKLYEAEEADPDRWGHGGFKELYPDAFSSSSSAEECEDRSRSKRRKKKKKAKKKDTSISKKRKHSGDSDSSEQREKRKISKKRKRKKSSSDDHRKSKLSRSTSNDTHSSKNHRQSSSIFIPAPADKDKSVRHRPKHKKKLKG